MIKHNDPVIPFYPYPVGIGNKWRCFDGEKWVDCDRFGHPLKSGKGR